MLGEITPTDQFTVARTVRTQFFSVPGRLVSRSGVPTLRTPSSGPGPNRFLRALDLLRGLPPVPCSDPSRGRRTADDGIRR